MKLETLVNTIEDVKAEFGLDFTDLKLIKAAKSYWDENRTIRITDLIRDFKIASPATIHYRVARDLVKSKMFKLVTNTDDAREKFVVAGSAFKKLEKFLEDK